MAVIGNHENHEDTPVLKRSTTLSALYKAVLDAGTSHISDLSTTCALPLCEVQQHVTDLIGLGILQESRSDVNAVRAVSPQLALLQTVKSTLEHAQKDLEGIEAVAMATEDRLKSYDPAISDIEIVSGLDLMTSRVSDLVNGASVSVDSLLPSVPKSETLNAALANDKMLTASSIRLRVVYPESVNFSPEVRRFLAVTGMPIDQVRTSPITPFRMVIVDERNAYIQLGGRNELLVAAIAGNQVIVDACMNLFDDIWINAKCIDPERDQDGITDRERSVLRSMMRKPNDRAIARELGISPRTVYRYIAELYQKTGTESRFALGAEAVLRGWLN